jgi:hypothetical protein
MPLDVPAETHDPAPPPAVRIAAGLALRADLAGNGGPEAVARLTFGGRVAIEPMLRYAETTGGVLLGETGPNDGYYLDDVDETYRELDAGALVRVAVHQRGAIRYDVITGATAGWDIWTDSYSDGYDYGYQTLVVGVDAGVGATDALTRHVSLGMDVLDRVFEQDRVLVDDDGDRQHTSDSRWAFDPAVRAVILFTY